MPKPYQKPHPKIAIAGMSPNPYFIQPAGKRGWIAITANFIPPDSVATHWLKYVEGCEEAGHAPALNGHEVNGQTVSLSVLMADKMKTLAQIASFGESINDVELIPPNLDDLYAHVAAGDSVDKSPS